MEDRLRSMAVTAAAAYMLGHAAPTLSMWLWVAFVASFAYYAFLLVKTLQAAVIAPMFWGLLSRVVVSRDLTREEFFRADQAPEDVAAKREAALNRMSAAWRERWPKVRETQAYLREYFSDLRFKASGFESMYPIFQKVVNDALDPITIVERTEGCDVIDAQGVRFLDVSGAYGVNCFGYTRSKAFLAEGDKLGQQLGPCLGSMGEVVADNIKMLKQIFDKEEVSLHMSGTEAVMSAVYQARFHTQRNLVAVFQGSYHGWWDGVMQGAGNDRFASDCLILKDQCAESLELLRVRRGEIAALIVNPISGFGWKNATTSKLGHSKVTAGLDSIEKFRAWLAQVRQVCTECGIPLVYDETWAFHLGPGGAQAMYGVKADMLVLGKSLGGGHATGAVLGPRWLMERRDPARPMRVNFVVGTFKGNPVVMGSMNAVLKWVTTPEAAKEFDGLKDRVGKWVGSCNAALTKAGLPLRVAAYRSTWCICYEQASIYNFLFAYYLREAGLLMAWVGTGKLLFTLEFSDVELKRLTDIIVSAGTQFKADGWWFEGGKPVNIVPLVVGPSFSYHSKWVLRKLGLA